MKKILIGGESWIKHISHIKGFDIFTSCEFETGVTWLKEALEKRGFEVTHCPGHEVSENFPYTPEELSAYGAVVLSDIGANSLLLTNKGFVKGQVIPDRIESIKTYVENGGGFCMIGGYLSFSGIDAKARYSRTAINEILPVGILDRDDRIEKPAGIKPRTVKADHPVFRGIQGDWPHFLGYNQLEARPEGEMLATVGDNHPFVAVRSFGKGRTAAFASDAAPHWGPPEFVNWKHYGDFWGNLFDWLCAK
ncbi:MAG: glutamine amidotransferase [Planctomycetota bacterium]|nr:glutamine amidotransferase [Planctomycetota bacterium]